MTVSEPSAAQADAASAHACALAALANAVEAVAEPFVHQGGRVVDASAQALAVRGLEAVAALGDVVRIGRGSGAGKAEVVALREAAALVKPYDDRVVARLGDRVWRDAALSLRPNAGWLGRAIDPFGRPVDGLGPLSCGDSDAPLFADPPPSLSRQRVGEPLRTGVRVIDIFTPLVRGQRIGLFAGSGVGKSTLLAMLTRAAAFDVAVVALVGERGREAREFLEDVLGDRRGRAIAIVATGDESAMMRRLAPFAAMAVAEFFRDQGAHVLLAVDSITRYAHAARDVALASGEPPVARGFPPSVFSTLPKLLERAGPGVEGRGAVTALFAVLVDGDDHNDPVADCARGSLDGHIVLDRAIADQGRYPAVNILASVSRLADLAWTPDERKAAQMLKAMAAQFEETRDMRMIAGHRAGADEALDKAVALTPRLYGALRQHPADPPSLDPFQETLRALQG
ncbi:MAG: FliI/YscN family ATPase [Hyphomicrobiales bacterium]|nr:FliI/YscN family ATPase [Hyphomicrobiales bacterium]